MKKETTNDTVLSPSEESGKAPYVSPDLHRLDSLETAGKNHAVNTETHGYGATS